MDSIDSQISYSLPQRHRAQQAAEQTDSTGLAAVHACWFYYEHVGRRVSNHNIDSAWSHGNDD